MYLDSVVGFNWKVKQMHLFLGVAAESTGHNNCIDYIVDIY